MQNRWTAWILTVAAALSLSPALWAQTSARPEVARNTPDLSGIWIQSPGRLQGRFSAEDAPLQPWALEVYKANRQGATNPGQSGLNGMDPAMYCVAEGVPAGCAMAPAAGLVHGPGTVCMFFQTL